MMIDNILLIEGHSINKFLHFHYIYQDKIIRSFICLYFELSFK